MKHDDAAQDKSLMRKEFKKMGFSARKGGAVKKAVRVPKPRKVGR